MLQLKKLGECKKGLGHQQSLCWHTGIKEVMFISVHGRPQSFAHVEECVEHGSFLIGTALGRLEVTHFSTKGLKFPIANGLNQ